MSLKYKALNLWDQYCDHKANKKYLRKYPDYEINEYNDGALKFIWGIASWDDLSNRSACLYTMNDIDITYNRDTKKYMLGVETAYVFRSKAEKCKYFERLLNAFTNFMNTNNYSMNEEGSSLVHSPDIFIEANSIEELYINFRIFVEGYCKVYGCPKI